MKKFERLPIILVVGGLIGFLASWILTIDKINLLKNPSTQLDCNINPILSCGSVMKTSEASIFGFANSLIGLPTFAIIVFIGLALLSGSKFSRGIWLTIQGGATLGIVMTHWLFFQSVYRIHALCPYCMSVWVVTMLIFWYVLIYNINVGNISVANKRVGAFINRYHLGIFLVWAFAVAALIIVHFWYYFKTIL